MLGTLLALETCVVVAARKLEFKKKFARTCLTLYYLYVAYYGLFVLDFAAISHPTWRNLQHHWWKCITVWNVVLQVRYSLMSLVIDILEEFRISEKVDKIFQKVGAVQDFCFVTLDLPISLCVCSLFWILCGVNRPLFFPAEMNSWIPDWYNHAVHTNPFFLVCYQMVTRKHRNPPFWTAFSGLFAHCFVYVSCILYTRWITGQWIYLVIGEVAANMSLLTFATLFCTVGFLFPFAVFLIFYKINHLVWEKSKIY